LWLQAATLAPGETHCTSGAVSATTPRSWPSWVGPTGHVTGYEIDADLAAQS
jgi:tRNA A58 N-methylase Trm61